MDNFRIEKIVPKSRTITINKLPFRSGEKVEVIVKSQKRTSRKRYPLRGKPYRFVDPFEPVAQNDWEANQ